MCWRTSIIEVGVIPEVPLARYLPGADPYVLLDLPCLVYVLDDGEHLVLVDSGPDAEAAARHGYRVLGETTSALLEGLARHGASAADVDLIVHTHLHYDHCQNDALLPRAQVVVQAEELRHARGGTRYYEGIAARCDALDDRLVLLDGDTALWPGLQTIKNGGHTPGHQSVLVETDDGPVCLCGDIVSLSVSASTAGDNCVDPDATQSFLRRCASETWELIPSHEPALREHRWFSRA